MYAIKTLTTCIIDIIITSSRTWRRPIISGFEHSARGVYHHKPPNTRRWYITHIDWLVIVHVIIYYVEYWWGVYASRNHGNIVYMYIRPRPRLDRIVVSFHLPYNALKTLDWITEMKDCRQTVYNQSLCNVTDSNPRQTVYNQSLCNVTDSNEV